MIKHNSAKHSVKIFSRFCFGLLVFCLIIILWGAWVRISHSGDGCGVHWPDCQGQYLIHKTAPAKTWIEWTHRASTALFGLLVLLLVALAFIKFPPRHIVRKNVLYILLFTVTEALIGAGLVLFSLTGANTSFARIFVMNLHLVNSLALTACLFMCWRFSLNKVFSFSGAEGGGRNANASSFGTEGGGITVSASSLSSTDVSSPDRAYFPCFIFIFFLIAFFGSISALSSTLYPSHSLIEGFLRDFGLGSSSFEPGSVWLIRLRWLHPLLAVFLGGGFALYCHKFFKNQQGHKDKSLILFTACLGLAIVSGVLNLVLLSPVILKLSHLLIVYLLAMSFLLALEKPRFNSS